MNEALVELNQLPSIKIYSGSKLNALKNSCKSFKDKINENEKRAIALKYPGFFVVLTYFTIFFNVSIVDFQQVNVCWELTLIILEKIVALPAALHI